MTSIRRATTDDADALSAIGRSTFSEAFGHLYRPADLTAFLSGAYNLEKMRRELADPNSAVWLAEAGSRLVGYAVAGPCSLPHPEVTGACGELKRLYVAPGAQGGGTGARLMEAALAWLERDGPRRLWIGLWSENLGALRLYQRFGFAKVGEYYFHIGEARDLEFILRRG